MDAIQKVSLYFSEGASDKEYHACIQSKDAGYVVDFKYGRRGAALTCGSKTASPVDLAKATKIFDKLVAEKKGKGYVEAFDGTPYQDAVDGKRPTGLLPQLLNDADAGSIESLINNPAWCAQEKMDGERRMASTSESSTFGSNRKGLETPLPIAVVNELKQMAGSAEVDAEQIGDVLHVFDLLSLSGTNLRGMGFEARHNRLRNLFLAGALPTNVRLVDRADTAESKRELYDRVYQQGGEGVVFKRKLAEYSPGRPNSGGDQLRFKFYATATVQVKAHNDQRSVQITVLDESGAMADIGNVTIPPNAAMPPVLTQIEVRYLYAYRNGSLYQPTFSRQRPDMAAEDCDQRTKLKYKGESLLGFNTELAAA
jgi:bifunctional non-homologous end joining protein LigD